MIVVLHSDYGYVLLAAVLFSFECLAVGLTLLSRIRSRLFSQKFMEEKFGAEHKKHFNEKIKKGGYPDTGSGLYSMQLSYKDWYLFNAAQRAHLNFVEWIASSLLFLLVAGISYPKLAAGLGFVMCLARLVYSIGYIMKGSYGRLPGALSNDLVVFILFILAILSSWSMANPPHVPATTDL